MKRLTSNKRGFLALLAALPVVVWIILAIIIVIGLIATGWLVWFLTLNLYRLVGVFIIVMLLLLKYKGIEFPQKMSTGLWILASLLLILPFFIDLLGTYTLGQALSSFGD